MNANTKRVVRAIALATGVGLPTLSLVPLGGIWLFNHGYVLHWALVMLGVIGLTTFLEWRWLGDRAGRPVASGDATTSEQTEAAQFEPGWSADEQRAWQEVLRIAKNFDPSRLSSRDDVLVLGEDTIRAVAQELHAGRRDPHLQFTLPEALAITEQVSRRLGAFITENIPLGDRLTVAHAMTLYRWRGAIGVAERAFDIWRLIRMVNPMTAATNELRERLTRQLYQWGRDHVTRSLAEAYVREIGRAAIDLYSGRMSNRVLRPDGPPPEPSPVDLVLLEPAQREVPPERAPRENSRPSRLATFWAQTRGAGRTVADTILRRRR